MAVSRLLLAGTQRAGLWTNPNLTAAKNTTRHFPKLILLTRTLCLLCPNQPTNPSILDLGLLILSTAIFVVLYFEYKRFAMFIPYFFSIAVFIASASAVYQGFNYGAFYTDSRTTSPVPQSDFENLFSTAQKLVGTSGFNSARLFTMIQYGTTNTPIEAIPAAINTKTSLLLGMWASAGSADFNNEIAALTSAISQYGTSFTSLIVGISVGSEDLYRNSQLGIAKMAGVGANPSDIVNYIKQVRSAIANTPASGALVGHVDTWTVWVNSSNDEVISACDFIGMDSYPYFETDVSNNSISLGYDVFFQTLNNTLAAVGDKPVWITETGWPVSGDTSLLAVASIPNAQTYWDAVGCVLFGKINTWWYTLQDAYPTTPTPSFGIVGSQLSTDPLFNLTCPAVKPNNPSPPPSGPVSSPPSSPVSSPPSSPVSSPPSGPVSSPPAGTPTPKGGTPMPNSPASGMKLTS